MRVRVHTVRECVRLPVPVTRARRCARARPCSFAYVCAEVYMLVRGMPAVHVCVCTASQRAYCTCLQTKLLPPSRARAHYATAATAPPLSTGTQLPCCCCCRVTASDTVTAATSPPLPALVGICGGPAAPYPAVPCQHHGVPTMGPCDGQIVRNQAGAAASRGDSSYRSVARFASPPRSGVTY